MYLTELLKDKLKAASPSRLVWTVSAAETLGAIDWNDIECALERARSLPCHTAHCRISCLYCTVRQGSNLSHSSLQSALPLPCLTAHCRMPCLNPVIQRTAECPVSILSYSSLQRALPVSTLSGSSLQSALSLPCRTAHCRVPCLCHVSQLTAGRPVSTLSHSSQTVATLALCAVRKQTPCLLRPERCSGWSTSPATLPCRVPCLCLVIQLTHRGDRGFVLCVGTDALPAGCRMKHKPSDFAQYGTVKLMGQMVTRVYAKQLQVCPRTAALHLSLSSSVRYTWPQ